MIQGVFCHILIFKDLLALILFSFFVLDGQIFGMESIVIDYVLTLLLIYRIQEDAKRFQTVCSKEKKS